MNPRDLSHEPDGLDGLDGLLRDARDELAAEIGRELHDIAPDFAAVVEAAHARDPQTITRATLDEALALAPVVVLSSDSSQRLSARGHAELGALLADARGEVDAELAALRRKGWPPVPVPKASQSQSARRNWVAWISAAAAALLIAVASPMLATRFEAARHTSQAPWWERATSTTQEAVWREAPASPAPAAPRPEPLLEPPEEIEPEPEEEAVTTVEAPPEQPVPKVRKSGPPPTDETMAVRLRRLGGEAELAWQSGDPAGAERKHREIITLAPGSRAADLSYGDLFTLARQRSGPEQEIALWHEYLAAFPHGRYADDARAGLCRRAEPEQRAACWQKYLTDFPAGVHRTQAERAQADASP